MSQSQKDIIAKVIKDTRLLKGYSQQELADLTQLNLRSIQRIENAEVLPRSSNLKRIAEGLGIDLELLVAEKDLIRDTPSAEKIRYKPLNKPRKLILTLLLGFLTVLLTAAYLSLSMRFPETSFELFLLLAGISCIYCILLWIIWRNTT